MRWGGLGMWSRRRMGVGGGAYILISGTGRGTYVLQGGAGGAALALKVTAYVWLTRGTHRPGEMELSRNRFSLASKPIDGPSQRSP